MKGRTRDEKREAGIERRENNKEERSNAAPFCYQAS
jgi:hypothetical protein